MKLAFVAITRHGLELACRLHAHYPEATLVAPEKLRTPLAAPDTHYYAGKLATQLPSLWASHDAIVAVVALGAVVRLIAPLLADKSSDPAVVVIDEAGQFVIPVLSGHVGGANALAHELAGQLQAQAVLTTASDARQTLAVDLLGQELGWQLEASHDALVAASAAMVNDEAVAVLQEAGRRDWWANHATGRSGPRPANLRYCSDVAEVASLQPAAALLCISQRPASELARLAGQLSGPLIHYRPPAGAPVPTLAMGLGCDRETPATTILQAIDAALAQIGATVHDVAHCASIDLKRDEEGLLAACQQHAWPLRFHSAATLAAVEVPQPSETVRRYTGTPSVAEAAALLAAGKAGAAAAMSALLVEKHKLRGPDGRNATVSIARIVS